MSNNSSVMLELERLEMKLIDSRKELEEEVDHLEGDMKTRDQKRKQLLLMEMKHILIKLNEEDKKIIQDLKGLAFDNLRGLNKVSKKVSELKKLVVKKEEVEVNLRLELDELLSEAVNLQVEEFTNCLRVAVFSDPSVMNCVLERVPDAIYLKTPMFSSKDFKVEGYENFQKEVVIHILAVSDDPQLSFNSNYVQKFVIVGVSSAVQMTGSRFLPSSVPVSVSTGLRWSLLLFSPTQPPPGKYQNGQI